MDDTGPPQVSRFLRRPFFFFTLSDVIFLLNCLLNLREEKRTRPITMEIYQRVSAPPQTRLNPGSLRPRVRCLASLLSFPRVFFWTKDHERNGAPPRVDPSSVYVQ